MKNASNNINNPKEDPYNNPFPTRLRELMADGDPSGKVTQTELAAILNLHRQTVSQYMDGSTKPPIDNLIKIANRFDVSTDYLLGLSDSKLPDIDDRDIHDKTGLSDIAIKALKNLKRAVSLYEGKDGQLPRELESVNILLEDMGLQDEDNPKTSFIRLFTRYRLFLLDSIDDKGYMTDRHGNIEEYKGRRIQGHEGTFHSADKFPFKVSTLENMFLMDIQERIKELKKEGESIGNHNTKKE